MVKGTVVHHLEKRGVGFCVELFRGLNACHKISGFGVLVRRIISLIDLTVKPLIRFTDHKSCDTVRVGFDLIHCFPLFVRMLK